MIVGINKSDDKGGEGFKISIVLYQMLRFLRCHPCYFFNMVLYTVESWFSHDSCPPHRVCPYCGLLGTGPPTAPAPITLATGVSTTPVVPPVAPPAATYVPVAPPTAPLTMNPLTAARAGRTGAISTSQATATRPPANTPIRNRVRLFMQVGHAIFKGTNPTAEFKPFRETWEVSILGNELHSLETLTEYLYSDGKSINVGMTYWSEAIEPDGQGEWQLRIGYITSVKQGGRYIRP